MGFSNILALCGGLGLFLFGMKYMGAGLELAAGPKLNNLLEKLTRNPVMGFLLGVFVTACVQSSSATTIMCMGFLNAGIMDLLQAAGVILGANVGTTMTSILIAAGRFVARSGMYLCRCADADVLQEKSTKVCGTDHSWFWYSVPRSAYDE